MIRQETGRDRVIVNACVSCSGSPEFDSRPRQLLFWHIFVVFSFVFRRKFWSLVHEKLWTLTLSFDSDFIVGWGSVPIKLIRVCFLTFWTVFYCLPPVFDSVLAVGSTQPSTQWVSACVEVKIEWSSAACLHMGFMSHRLATVITLPYHYLHDRQFDLISYPFIAVGG
jgi:hypothetical protein